MQNKGYEDKAADKVGRYGRTEIPQNSAYKGKGGREAIT